LDIDVRFNTNTILDKAPSIIFPLLSVMMKALKTKTLEEHKDAGLKANSK